MNKNTRQNTGYFFIMRRAAPRKRIGVCAGGVAAGKEAFDIKRSISRGNAAAVPLTAERAARVINVLYIPFRRASKARVRQIRDCSFRSGFHFPITCLSFLPFL